ncbi:MAG: SLBB domain-containing protein [Candidatus Poribacteria bacterium]|nr:SLBB domain-containing protein [Candidatus Poribacteria bacterium]
MICFLRSLQASYITPLRLQAFIIFFFLFTSTTLFGDVYRIRKGDNLLIAVIGQPEYSQSVIVREDGRISYFGGDLQVAGKTTEEVNKVIRDFLLKSELVNNPVIMVSSISQENGVYVGGAVTNPGRYVIFPENDIDLSRAIALAGGMTENADVQQVQLIRYNAITHSNDTSKQSQSSPLPPQKQTTQVETYDLSTNQPYLDIRVNANDLVFVMPLSVIEVQGEVKVPGKLFIRRKISIANALARAGGFTEEADLTALVKVAKDNTLTELGVTEQFWKPTNKNGTEIFLSDGDVLFVPNAFKVEPIYVNGYVRTPGEHRVRGPVTLQKAIAKAGGFEKEANRKKFHIHRKDGTTTEHLFKPGTDTTLLYPGDILEIHKRFQINWGLFSTIASTTIAITYFVRNLTGD